MDEVTVASLKEVVGGFIKTLDVSGETEVWLTEDVAVTFANKMNDIPFRDAFFKVFGEQDFVSTCRIVKSMTKAQLDGYIAEDNANYTGILGATMFLYAGKNSHESNGDPAFETKLALDLIDKSIEDGTDLSLVQLIKRALDFQVPASVFFDSVVNVSYEEIVASAGN